MHLFRLCMLLSASVHASLHTCAILGDAILSYAIFRYPYQNTDTSILLIHYLVIIMFSAAYGHRSRLLTENLQNACITC